MTVSDIETQAKKENAVILHHKKWARIEERKLIAQSSLSLEEKHAQIKKINKGIPFSARNMVMTNFHCPKEIRDLIDTLVALGYFGNRSDFIRQAVTDAVSRWADIITQLKV